MREQQLFYRGWTREENEKAKALWLAGRTGGQIAKALGRSRGSVLGKINRMGLIATRKQDKPQRPKRRIRTKQSPPKTPAENGSCFRCGSRWGLCEHTKEAA